MTNTLLIISCATGIPIHLSLCLFLLAKASRADYKEQVSVWSLSVLYDDVCSIVGNVLIRSSAELV